jgi:hypothetical protein
MEIQSGPVGFGTDPVRRTPISETIQLPMGRGQSDAAGLDQARSGVAKHQEQTAM